MSAAIFTAINLVFALGREWIVAAQTGWRRLWRLSELSFCLSLAAQLAAFQEAVPFLGTKLTLLKSQRV
jgi:hypothetical protein